MSDKKRGRKQLAKYYDSSVHGKEVYFDDDLEEFDNFLEIRINQVDNSKNQEYPQDSSKPKNLVKSITIQENSVTDLIPVNVPGGDWPQKTNSACWWCCHPFNGVPLGAPVGHDSTSLKYYAKGFFCGVECLVSYCNTDKSVKRNDLVDVIRRMTNWHWSEDLPCAPPRETLSMFGGPLSIEEFRENSFYTFKLVYSPLQTIGLSIQKNPNKLYPVN